MKTTQNNEPGAKLNLYGGTIKASADDYVFVSLPPPVGRYIVNEHMHWSFPKKPKFIHRFFSKLLLGGEWIDDDVL